MTFDKRWLQFEITHGPQSPGAKEDALFWYNAGQKDVPCVATQKEDAAETVLYNSAAYGDGMRDGQNKILHFVENFANADVPEDPLTKENLLQFLETLR